MGQVLSVSLRRRDPIDLKTGLGFHKILSTKHSNIVTSLKIQPSGYLVAAADETGRLLFFDLPSSDVIASQSRQLLKDHGGISELCWLGDDIIAVGTTRGKIIVFSCRNNVGRFSHVCDVEAHGDGVSQVAVECMEFSGGIRCLASVGEGRNGIRLWDVDNTGTLNPRAIGHLLPEYSIPRFVGFANDDTELLVGYLEQAIVKRYSIDPWQLLERKLLNQSDELEAASEVTENRNCCFIGNALLLPRTKQLAVFNLQNGLDIYGYPDLVCKHVARYEIESCTSQGLAAFRSGKFLASPTNTGRILIFDTCDASVITTLQTSQSNQTFQAVDALTIPIRNAEYVVGASIRKGTDTCIVVWRRNVQSHSIQPVMQASHSGSLFRQLAVALLVYLLCTFMPPVLLSVVPDGFVWKNALPWI